MADQENPQGRGDGWPGRRDRAAVARDRGRAPRSDAHGPAARGRGARTRLVSDARALNAWRRWGYRLLPGELFSYIMHMRPAEWPIMAAHTLLGYVLAVGPRGAGSGEPLVPALGALAIWVICPQGGPPAPTKVLYQG